MKIAFGILLIGWAGTLWFLYREYRQNAFLQARVFWQSVLLTAAYAELAKHPGAVVEPPADSLGSTSASES